MDFNRAETLATTNGSSASHGYDTGGAVKRERSPLAARQHQQMAEQGRSLDPTAVTNSKAQFAVATDADRERHPHVHSVDDDEDEHLSDDALIALPIRELNKRMKDLDRETQMRVKQKRRTLKNRGYAQSCRSRRMQTTRTLDEQKAQLEREIEVMSEEMKTWRAERDQLKAQLVQALQGRDGDEVKQSLQSIRSNMPAIGAGR